MVGLPCYCVGVTPNSPADGPGQRGPCGQHSRPSGGQRRRHRLPTLTAWSSFRRVAWTKSSGGCQRSARQRPNSTRQCAVACACRASWPRTDRSHALGASMTGRDASKVPLVAGGCWPGLPVGRRAWKRPSLRPPPPSLPALFAADNWADLCSLVRSPSVRRSLGGHRPRCPCPWLAVTSVDVGSHDGLPSS